MKASLGPAVALALTLATAAFAVDPGVRQRPAVTVRPAKSEFTAGEPIGIEITIANPGPMPAEFWLDDALPFNPTFTPIRFDGGRAAPPRPAAGAMFSGRLLATTHTLPAAARWPLTAYLQNFVQQPPPGEHRIRYRFAADYFLGQRPEGEAFDRLLKRRFDGQLENDGPSLDAEGSFTIRIGPRDPAALERIFKGYVEEFRSAQRDDDPERRIEQVLGAFQAVDDPAVIPHLAALLRVADSIGVSGPFGIAPRVFAMLARFRDHDAARRVMIDQLFSRDGSDVSRAFEWLREGRVPIPTETLVAILDRDDARGDGPDSTLIYLQFVPAPPTPALRERLIRCLRSPRRPEAARALLILGRMKAPRDAAVGEALTTLYRSLDEADSYHVAVIVDALGAWRFPIAVDRLSALLRKSAGDLGPLPGSIVDYLARVRDPAHRALEPQVADLLISQTVEVKLAALRVLALWGHELNPKESEALLRNPGAVREATTRYLERQRPQGNAAAPSKALPASPERCTVRID